MYNTGGFYGGPDYHAGGRRNKPVQSGFQVMICIGFETNRQ